jgi:hypothetical protein
MVPVYVFVYWIFPRQRKNMLFSSLLAIPQAFSGLILTPGYWNPDRILVFGIGPEDILFMVIVGGMAWVENVLIVRNRIITEVRLRILLLRYMLHLGFFVGAFFVVRNLGLHEMDIAFLAMMVWIALMLLRNPRLWPMAATGSLISFCLYVSLFLVGYIVWPEFLSNWTWENLWGLRLGPLPLEEVVWAVLYSPAWGLTMAFILDARLPRKAPR